MEKKTPKNITLNLILFPLADSAGYLWLTMLTTDGNAHRGSTHTGMVLQEQQTFLKNTSKIHPHKLSIADTFHGHGYKIHGLPS